MCFEGESLSRESLSKIERQRQLARYLERDPFLTDVDLSKILRVSIQTIRLDRLDLKIPELRERLKNVARSKAPQLKSMTGGELLGDLMVLPRYGNTTATVLDVVLAAVVIGLSDWMINGFVTLTPAGWVLFLGVLAIGEWLFHKYLKTSPVRVGDAKEE
jgi:hypothetical protein